MNLSATSYNYNNQYNNDYNTNNYNYNYNYNDSNNDNNDNIHNKNINNPNPFNPCPKTNPIIEQPLINPSQIINITCRAQFFSLQLLGFLICYTAIFCIIYFLLIGESDPTYSLYQIYYLVIIIYSSISAFYLLQHIIFFFILDMPILKDYNVYLMRRWTLRQRIIQEQIIKQSNNHQGRYGTNYMCGQPGVELFRGFMRGIVGVLLMWFLGYQIGRYLFDQEYRVKVKIVRMKEYQKIYNMTSNNMNNTNNMVNDNNNNYMDYNTQNYNNQGYMRNNNSPFINNNNNAYQFSDRKDARSVYP